MYFLSSTVVVSLIAGLFAASCYADSTAAASATVREVGGCSSALPWSKRSEVDAVSREGNELVVSVLANAACGALRAEEPQVTTSANTVALSWTWVNHPKGAPLASCLCTRHLQFRVSGAPEGDVIVTAETRAK